MFDTRPLRICMLGAEAAPYAAAGEISEVLSGLPAALRRLGHDVRTLIPLHRCVKDRFSLEKVFDLDPISIGDTTYQGSLFRESSGIENYFVGCAELFDRDGIYQDASGQDFPDNFERFDFLSLATFEALEKLDWCPDVLHCHDSHTALVPAYLKLTRMGDTFFSGISSVLTVYDLSYHAQYPGEKFHLTSLPGELFYPMGAFEYYGKLSTLKAGICYADVINTVSHQYAREIQTKEYGCGLEEVLRRRKAHLFGVLNGIDVRRWNPETDPFLEARYSSGDLTGKKIQKKQLQCSCGFEPREVPLIGIVAHNPRLDGMELLLESWDALSPLDCQWVIVPEILARISPALQAIADRAPDRLHILDSVDESIVHQFHAGCDLFAAPSRSQPCGMHQLYSMRYGTIPIVRHAGGLVETVVQFEEQTGLGNGFKFYSYDAESFSRALLRAVRLWTEDREKWEVLIRTAMSRVFSWDNSAAEYDRLYRRAIAHI